MKITQFCRDSLASLFGICGIDLDADVVLTHGSS
jgi:hypothetical protein